MFHPTEQRGESLAGASTDNGEDCVVDGSSIKEVPVVEGMLEEISTSTFFSS